MREGWQNDHKSQRNTEFSVRFVPPGNVRSYTHSVTATELPKKDPNKDNSRHDNVDVGGPFYRKNFWQLRNAGSRRNGLSHREHTNWLFSTK